jgi:UDP-N-acetylglucosamine 2-epimerase (non-hydrolysing)
VEAGLRTGDVNSPFPEEANRAMLARIARIHFAPTQKARLALLKEGVEANKICVTGNTVVDAIELAKKLLKDIPTDSVIQGLQAKSQGKPLILVTCHRRENFGGILEGICELLARLCQRYEGYHWVFPISTQMSENQLIEFLEILAISR